MSCDQKAFLVNSDSDSAGFRGGRDGGDGEGAGGDGPVRKCGCYESLTLPVMVALVVFATTYPNAASSLTSSIQRERPNWPTSTNSYSTSVGLAIGAASAFFAGPQLKIHGPRKMVTFSAFCCGFGAFLAALAIKFTGPWLFFIGYALLGHGIGVAYIAVLITIIQWHPQRKGTIGGIVGVFVGTGGILQTQLVLSILSTGASASTVLLWEALVAGGLQLLSVPFLRSAPSSQAPASPQAPSVKEDEESKLEPLLSHPPSDLRSSEIQKN